MVVSILLKMFAVLFSLDWTSWGLPTLCSCCAALSQRRCCRDKSASRHHPNPLIRIKRKRALCSSNQLFTSLAHSLLWVLSSTEAN